MEKCSVNVVRSNPKENQQTHRSSRQESNWLDQRSNEFLQKEQDRDPVIFKVKNPLLESTVRIIAVPLQIISYLRIVPLFMYSGLEMY